MIRLRPATTADLELLIRWDEAPHVAESDPNSDWGWAQELGRARPGREQLIAERDGAPIGYVEIMDPHLDDEHYWGECPPGLRSIDIWIGEARELNQGHGTEMMKQALARCFAPTEVTAVLLDPIATNTRARRFYERLGFRYLEDRQLGADLCAVYRLDRSAWQP